MVKYKKIKKRNNQIAINGKPDKRMDGLERQKNRWMGRFIDR